MSADQDKKSMQQDVKKQLSDVKSQCTSQLTAKAEELEEVLDTMQKYKNKFEQELHYVKIEERQRGDELASTLESERKVFEQHLTDMQHKMKKETSIPKTTLDERPISRYRNEGRIAPKLATFDADKLNQRFGNKDLPYTIRRQLQDVRQNGDEMIDEFAEREQKKATYDFIDTPEHVVDTISVVRIKKSSITSHEENSYQNGPGSSPNQNFIGIMMPYIVTTPDKIRHLTGKNISLRKGTNLGTAVEINEVIENQNPEQNSITARQISKDGNHSKKTEEVCKNMLENLKDLFERSKENLNEKECNQLAQLFIKLTAQVTLGQVGDPMERVHMDIFGPLVESISNNKYVLAIIDQFTKWIEFVTFPNQNAETITTAAVKNFFSKFGCALQIHTDQGRNFESNLFHELCRLLEITKT
ncbi:Hypothetical predicted protein [Mytilus galloprovincialis]|uniref:Integrase catalytic domain-containing protein n=1 Tax=Mytilus galloprovincialis TaxID=29158 RepID=A0A8B6C221_MYTGA|nr:Hypothetical predicted protein [Mytilus galloprovincialis]